MTEKDKENIRNLVNVCATIVVNADPSDSRYLEDILRENNRSIFVSSAILVGLRHPPQPTTKALSLYLKMTVKDLHHILSHNVSLREEDFALMVRNEIQRLRTGKIS